MNMIDQIAAFLTPFIAGTLLDTYSGAFCCIAIMVWNIISWALEAVVLLWIYSKTPELSQSRGRSPCFKFLHPPGYRTIRGGEDLLALQDVLPPEGLPCHVRPGPPLHDRPRLRQRRSPRDGVHPFSWPYPTVPPKGCPPSSWVSSARWALLWVSLETESTPSSSGSSASSSPASSVLRYPRPFFVLVPSAPKYLHQLLFHVGLPPRQPLQCHRIYIQSR